MFDSRGVLIFVLASIIYVLTAEIYKWDLFGYIAGAFWLILILTIIGRGFGIKVLAYSVFGLFVFVGYLYDRSKGSI